MFLKQLLLSAYADCVPQLEASVWADEDEDTMIVKILWIAVVATAVTLGLSAVENKPYKERQGGFIDAAGNTWWVATYLT